MSPTSRNVLMIGGALILIALLLICGPLSDRLGDSGQGVHEAPPVAAGPPPDAIRTTDLVEAVAAGALVGRSMQEPEVAAASEDAAPVEAPVAVPVPVVSETPGSEGGGRPLPLVSAAAPMPIVASEEISGVAPAEQAAGAFDDQLASLLTSNDELAGPGPAVDRFPPPVAAAGAPLALDSAAQSFGFASGKLLQPCDSPGSGCRTVISGQNGGGGGVFLPSPPVLPPRGAS